MTGIPARSAAWIAGASAAGFGSETTKPEGLVAAAACISWPMRAMSWMSGASYVTDTPSWAAAACAPFWTTAQNGSDACP